MSYPAPSALPSTALLARYGHDGGYVDCFATTLPCEVVLADFVEAFYTGRVFKLERFLLGVLLSHPATDAQARQLGLGESDRYAVWRVEERTADQLLMRPLDGRTRSWFMVAPSDDARGTLLFFGSALVPRRSTGSDAQRMGWLYVALLRFHRWYSRILLGGARSRLLARHPPP